MEDVSLEVGWIPQLADCKLAVLTERWEIFLFVGFCLQNGAVESLQMSVSGFDLAPTVSFCQHVSIL